MITRRERLAMSVGSLVLAIGAVIAASSGLATEAPPAPARATPPSSSFRPARPYWIELPQAQRQALAPLADDWEHLDLQTKKKWVEIANRFPKMSPDEQGRSQQRMREWARLTPEQRRTARDSFERIRAMNPEQRAEMLRKYQELPPERRQALTARGQANKGIVVPKPVPAPAERRVQIREGAKVRNPAVAAQKSNSAIVAPARKPVESPKAADAPAAVAAPTTPAVTTP